MGKGLGLKVGREGAQPEGGRGVSLGPAAMVQDFGLHPEYVSKGPAPEPYCSTPRSAPWRPTCTRKSSR